MYGFGTCWLDGPQASRYSSSKKMTHFEEILSNLPIPLLRAFLDILVSGTEASHHMTEEKISMYPG